MTHGFDLLYELVARDLKLRYKRSVLGVAWSLLNPLMQLLVFAFVFGTVLPLGIPDYVIFLFTGILAWNWFHSSLLTATSTIVDNRDLVKRPGFPAAILPAVHTDMPLAAIGEEFGLFGAVAIIACFAILTLRGLRAALIARTTFGRLLAAGLAMSIGLQAWIIMAGNANLAPLTGVTLPFVSYGGSSLLISFIMIGLLLQVSVDRD